MSGNVLYEFRKSEIQDLLIAKDHTVGACSRLKLLREDILRNDRDLGAWSIVLILDHRCQRESCLNPVVDLLEEVAQSVTIPSLWACHSDDAERRVEEVMLAHRAAWKLHTYIRNYLWQVSRRGQPRDLEPNDVGAACDEIVESHWQELRDELKPLVDFDCEGLRHAVEAESKAAIARRRQNIVGDATVTPKPSVDADIPLSDSAADELDKACQEELNSALQAHGIRTEVAAKLTLEQRRNIIMAHWGCTPSKTRDKWLETKWRPFLGKQSKTKLADNVKSYIKRGRDKLEELASRK